MRKYEFTKDGIKQMYNDSLEAILDTLDGSSNDFTIDQLDIEITIGNKQIIVPTDADTFDALFSFLAKAEDME